MQLSQNSVRCLYNDGITGLPNLLMSWSDVVRFIMLFDLILSDLIPSLKI